MKTVKILINLCFVIFVILQIACNDAEKTSNEAIATDSVGSPGLTALPSSVLVVAEKNQVFAYGSDGNKGWTFTLPENDTVATKPAAALSSTTYVRGATGLYALAPDGKLIWQAKHNGVNDALKGITALSDSTVALTSSDNSLVGYNMQGQPKWRFKMPEGEKITSSPALSASSLTYLRSAKKIYAIDSQGNLAWSAEIGSSAKR